MTSFMRHIATKVLFVLLVAWLLAVLQPCCEAIASTIPHDHGLTQEVHHTDQEHSTTNTGGVTDHQHCETADMDIGEISVLVGEKQQITKPKPKSDVIAVWEIFPSDHLVSSVRSLPNLHHPPPGRYDRVYLQTQRLRI